MAHYAIGIGDDHPPRHGDPQLTDHLRSVLAEANGQPHSAEIADGHFCLICGYGTSFTPYRSCDTQP